MESRTYQRICELQENVKSGSKNVLLLTHNSLLRCLKGNLEKQQPKSWIESHLDNACLYDFTSEGLIPVEKKSGLAQFEELIHKHVGDCLGIKYNTDLANDFARIVKGEETKALKILMQLFPQHMSAFVNSFKRLLENSIEIHQTFQNLAENCKVKGVDTILQFGSSVFGRNYSVGKQTDLDVELVVNETFDIKDLADTVFREYGAEKIICHYHDFLKS